MAIWAKRVVKVKHCGCGRTMPPGRTLCPRCTNTNTASTRSKTSSRRCGRPVSNSLSGCGGFVPAGGRCDRCGQS